MRKGGHAACVWQRQGLEWHSHLHCKGLSSLPVWSHSVRVW